MADVIQGLAMIVISITIVIHGTMIADGGVEAVVTKSYERGRLDFFE